MTAFHTDVVIAGGGPVGLTLGHALAHHGLRCLVAERNPATTRAPKMDITNSRSMELFASLGLDALIRRVAVPSANNFDVTWVTRVAGHELHRFRYPSQDEKWAAIRAANDGSQPAEPAVRISQIVLEPALKAALEERPGVEVRFGWAFERFVADADGVTVTLREGASGREQAIRCRFLVGCDGAGSAVRRQLGIGLEGDSAIRASYMVHFRSRDRRVLQHLGQAWHYQAGRGTLIAQDDEQFWTLQVRPPANLPADQVDPRAVLRDFIGAELEAEILLANAWSAHLLVAESYGRGRVLLAGDSVHQVVPTGGYGMNTGVGDALDLAWKLAATVQGWGGPRLLDSYEAERRPVALRNREASRANMEVRVEIAKAYLEAGEIDGDGAAAAERRARLGARIAAFGNAENERWGIEHGYVYEGSAIVDAAGQGAPPPFDPLRYQPTTFPGARLPHLFLEDGTGLYRRLGRGFTLIAFGDAETGAAEAAARARGMPFATLRLAATPARRRLYERDLLLIRPDHHIAWRGDTAPRDWSAVLGRVTGHEDGVRP